MVAVVPNAEKRGMTSTTGNGSSVRTINAIRFVRFAEKQVKSRIIAGSSFREPVKKNARDVVLSVKHITLQLFPGSVRKDVLHAERSVRSNMSSNGTAAGEPAHDAAIKPINGTK